MYPQAALPWRNEGFSPQESQTLLYRFKDSTVAKKWKDLGFTASEMQELYRFKDPTVAKEWKDLGFTASEMQEWGPEFELKELRKWLQINFNKEDISACKRNGYTSDDVNVLKQSSLSIEDVKALCKTTSKQIQTNWETNKFTLKEFLCWRQGFSLEEAMEWRKAQFACSEAYKYKSFSPQAAVKVKRVCPSGLNSISNLFSANPYDVAGKCYEFVGETQQILSRSTALFNLSGRGYYIDFGKTSAPAIYFRGVVKGVGVYEYTTTIGAAKKVPHLRSVYQSE